MRDVVEDPRNTLVPVISYVIVVNGNSLMSCPLLYRELPSNTYDERIRLITSLNKSLL